ncbi:Molybdopterin molybdenumtransferase（MoeA, N-terminal and linker domain,10-179；Molybdopterin binding,167-335；MoeA, C-terminal, domain IV,330-411&|uniref:molybdopterin molybdotransferase MoeA n=1 Tax=Magnetospirillum sp. XM-1 TaxID=1663591 RepID=UPI00073DCA36|nr:gephyrin-like molybdotransferase Glp [Magnetospirillum sp. XM-1]CUW38632.1 Molybdopterin molybdenumtransferase\
MTDRFVPDKDMMTVAEALARLDARLSPVVGTEELGLHHALGRILAEDVVSSVNVPPHDNSAVDGWAFCRADLPADGCLPVVGRVAAGHPLDGPLPRVSAVRIFTGAPLPEGADTVAMQEDCKDQGESVVLPIRLSEGDNARAAGEDIAKGAVVLHAGTRLRPQELGVAAATGRSSLKVYRPLKAAVFSTGDEIRDPGTELAPGCIYDTNRFTASGLLRALGAEVTDLGILPDRFETIRDALAEAARSHDLILTSGGVSVGDEDHVKPAVLALGSLDFWRLAIKPGRPVALGEVAGTPFVGLPGNPVAVMVTFMAIARPMVLRLMGAAQTALPRYSVEAGFAFKHKPGRREYLRARLAHMDGRLVAAKFTSDGSGVLTSMTWSDGLVDVPEDRGDIAPGEMVDFLSYADMMR